MGYCLDGEDRFDVFLSYASADDKAHNGWVSNFQRYLEAMVPAELTRSQGADRDRIDLFQVCRDKTGFPPAGELDDVIKQSIRHSEFLIIFLGKGYLASKWCLSELDTFRQNAGGALSQTLPHLYLIVLDREAVIALRGDGHPSALSPNLTRFWSQLQGVTTRAVRVEGFIAEDGLVPVYQDTVHADHRFHEVGKGVVAHLVQKLIQRRRETRPGTALRPAQAARKILLGAVPDRQAALRDALFDALTVAGVRVERIERADSMNRDVISGGLRGSTYFVQPYDHAAPMGDDILPGGHLAVAQAAFQEAFSSVGGPRRGTSLLWWLADREEYPAVANLGEETRAFLDRIDALPPGERRVASAAELAVELGGQTRSATVAARIWIEWAKSDDRTIALAKEKVRDKFQALCRERAGGGPALSARLKFLTADWQKLEQKIEHSDKPDGLVIVYNEHKDQAAFDEQSDRISGLEDVLQQRMFPGVFYMRPDDGFYAWDDWTSVRFSRVRDQLSYDEEELRQFVEKLYDIIERKYPGLTTGSPP